MWNILLTLLFKPAVVADKWEGELEKRESEHSANIDSVNSKSIDRDSFP